MNYQITDAKTRYFNDKEHYLNFLKAWKRAANKSVSKGEEWGCLTGAHMVMYALLRGRDVRTAFTPITKQSKLENGFYINHGMYWAAQDLAGLARSWNQEERVKKFLAPFAGTIEPEVLFKLIDEMPQIPALYSNYGKGKKVALTLIETEERDNKVLWSLIEEAA